RMTNWDEAEYAFTICVTQAPLFAAGYRMLGEIARRHKGDPSKQAFFHEQVKVARARRQELKDEKKTAIYAAQERESFDEDSRPMPELEPDPKKLKDVPAEEIITVVSGLPRSGTSLMMQILEAAGVELYTDGVRTADESNEKGYFEHEKVPSLLTSKDRSWIAEAKGQGIKVVSPLLSSLPLRQRPGKGTDDGEVEAGGENGRKKLKPLHYRVLYMERDMDEILESQKKFLERAGKESPADANEKALDIAKAYGQQARRAKEWCQSSNVQAMGVDYAKLVTDPEEIVEEVAEFLGVPEKAEVLKERIDPNLYRARKA
ncbi:MAG: sulfotransferase, partial [Verrucomicrobiota bacterium]